MLRVSVRVWSAMKAVTLDDTLETATLRRSGNLDLITGCEDVYRNLVTELVLGGVSALRAVVDAEAAKYARSGGQSCLCGVTDNCLVRAATAGRLFALLVFTSQLLLSVAELHGRNTGGLGSEDLHNWVGRSLDYGARDLLSLFVEDLGHAQLLPNDSDHFSIRP